MLTRDLAHLGCGRAPEAAAKRPPGRAQASGLRLEAAEGRRCQRGEYRWGGLARGSFQSFASPTTAVQPAGPVNLRPPGPDRRGPAARITFPQGAPASPSATQQRGRSVWWDGLAHDWHPGHRSAQCRPPDSWRLCLAELASAWPPAPGFSGNLVVVIGEKTALIWRRGWACTAELLLKAGKLAGPR